MGNSAEKGPEDPAGFGLAEEEFEDEEDDDNTDEDNGVGDEDSGSESCAAGMVFRDKFDSPGWSCVFSCVIVARPGLPAGIFLIVSASVQVTAPPPSEN
ncbi:MAG TPA: hypothetical protein VGM18_13695 [Candidatus Sulfotelmatobacter sp.]